MFWGLITITTDQWHLAALTSVMILLAEIEEALAPDTETSDAMILVESVSMEGMLFLQTLGRFSILFLSKSDSDAKLVMPSWVTRSTEASELNLMLLETLIILWMPE